MQRNFNIKNKLHVKLRNNFNVYKYLCQGVFVSGPKKGLGNVYTQEKHNP